MPKVTRGRNSIMTPWAQTREQAALSLVHKRAVLLGPGHGTRRCNEAADSDIGEGWS